MILKDFNSNKVQFVPRSLHPGGGNSAKKYLQIFKISWQESLVYRFNFLVWRIESVVLFLTIYFFWFAVYRFNKQIGGYDEKLMLTYIIGTSILRALVLNARSDDVSREISTGGLSNYLLKPLNYFYYWLARDFADKILNLIFVFLELSLIFLILKPSLFIQTSPFYLLSFATLSILGIFIYFYLNLLISLITFWYPEHSGWPARFLFFVITQFLTGELLPLDVLPKPVFISLKFLPTTYLRFFPLQVYLERLNKVEILVGLVAMIFWIMLLRFLTQLIWQKGLKSYTAAGI